MPIRVLLFWTTELVCDAAELKDDLSNYLRMAENEEIIITRHGRPAGILVGFASEEEWFDYQIEYDPRFLKRIATARDSLQLGKGVKFEDLPKVLRRRSNG